MGTRTYLWFLLCFAGFLSVSLLPSGGSIYTTVFFILVIYILKDKAVVVWKNLRESSSPGIVVPDPSVKLKIDSLRQGERTVEEYFEEFGVLWKELETLHPLPECACGAECLCSDALRGERKKWKESKVASFLKGLNDESQKILSVLSLNEDYDWVVTGIHKIRLDHSIHPCPLTLKLAGESYTCSGCKELGFGRSYRSESSECNDKCGVYVLHEDCANAANVDNNSPVPHSFFKGSNFSFLKEPPSHPRICNACKKDVKGFVYHCPAMGTKDLNDTGKDLHPCCLKLKDSIFYREGNVALKLSETTRAKCKKCWKVDKKNGKGWSYASSNGKHCYHVSCFKELNYEEYRRVIS